MRTFRFLRGALILALLLLSGCSQPRGFSITFGGDVMLARNRIPLFTQDPWGVLEQLSPNLFFVNLESPLTESPSSTSQNGYNLCASADQVKWLVQGGVNLVSAENNHNLDCGETGADADEAILEPEKISVVGGARNPIIYESKGVKIGVYAANLVEDRFSKEELLKKIKELRPNCDVLVVSLHWGSEYQAGVSELQQHLAQILADQGVDILWGHHPHVLQKIMVVHSAVTGRDMLAMYSLGNLLSDQWMNEDALNSGLVTVHFTNKQWSSVEITPIRMDHSTHRLIAPDAQTDAEIKDRLGEPLLAKAGWIIQK